jgi:hypothetical protein
MNKKTMSAILLTICTYGAMAQYKVNVTIAPTPNCQGSYIPGVAGNSIILGDGNTTAPNNVIVGYGTGTAVPSGSGNTIVGQGTGSSMNTGYANTFLGNWVGGANTNGFANTFIGQYSGIATTSGYHNSFFGQGAGNGNTTGFNNTFIGTGAGSSSVNGVANTALGSGANVANGLSNSTAIGVNSLVTASNALVLGGTGGNAVNVGIGVTAPTAHLHTANTQPENILFSTSNTSGFSATTINLVAPGTFPNNTLKVQSNANTNSGTLLVASGAPVAPAIPYSNMATVLTNGSSLAIGVDGYELNKTGSIHFMNYVMNAGSVYNKAEIMRINKDNGFVGINTRLAASAGGSGNPQAMFHVNLTNPINSSLNMLTQGIRFEGLPRANHPDVIVIDANGNLAKAPYSNSTVSNSWLTIGNTTTGSEFIGTLTSDDFRIRTNNVPVARFTSNGNFDMGANTTTAATSTSAAVGTNNVLDGAVSSIATGTDNEIRNSDNSGVTGDLNSISSSSTGCQASGNQNVITQSYYSMALGNENIIDASTAVLAGGSNNQIDQSSSQMLVYGDRNRVSQSYSSGVIGEDNQMYNAHGCFIGGGHSYSDGSYNLLLGNRLRADVVPTLMPSTPLNFTSIMLIGEQVHSDLGRSLTIGFTGNRTSVTTQRGMAVQLDPTTLNTYNPTVNFEVEASIGTSSPMPLSGPVRSNIRFHNLPLAPYAMPAVVVDPATGELFQTANSYSRSADGNQGVNLDSVYNRISLLESQLSAMDEKFARLERAVNQICEGGCEGMKPQESDALFQSVPNPTNSKVEINYYLSRNYGNANISLYNFEGAELRSYKLTPNKGDGSISIVVEDLQPGTYLYRLTVDGKQVSARKLQKQ